MTDKNLFSAIGNIDEKYIEEAADEERARPRLLALRYLAVAAAFMLVITASIGIFKNSPKKSSPQTEGVFVGLSGENPDTYEPADSTDITSQLTNEGENAELEADSADTPTDATGTRGENYSLVQINLENGIFYRYLSDSEISSLTIKPINKDNLGEKIAVLTPNNTTLDSLAGCEIFRHKEIACDGLIILKNGDELIPFVFLGFKSGAHDFSEILAIHGAVSSTDIVKITTHPLHTNIYKEKTVTDSNQIKSVYDILVNIENDNGKNDEIKKEYQHSSNRIYVYFKLHFKNGLTYQSFYRVCPDKSYISDHDFLSSEQNEILRNILLN